MIAAPTPHLSPEIIQIQDLFASDSNALIKTIETIISTAQPANPKRKRPYCIQILPSDNFEKRKKREGEATCFPLSLFNLVAGTGFEPATFGL